MRSGLFIACGVAVLLAGMARGQELHGPPMPGAVPTWGEPDARAGRGLVVNPPEINPLSVLAGASEVLPFGSSGAYSSAASRADSGAGSETGKKGGLSTAINILIVLTVVGLAPSIILMCTCFVRVLIVLGFLKQALGTSTVPPPQVITGLAMFMTLLAMGPTIDRLNAEAVGPYQRGEIRDYDELWEKTKAPIRDFMFNQIEATGNWSSLYMLLEQRGIDTSEPEKLTRADVPMTVLIPAYMLSELKTAFLMGFRVYLPFLVIDMVISTMLISMSMMMLPPVLISLPFKILLFVMVDGWAMVVGNLLSSVAAGGAG